MRASVHSRMRTVELDEVFASGEGGGFGPVADAELGDQVGDVGLDGAGADEEGFGDFAV